MNISTKRFFFFESNNTFNESIDVCLLLLSVRHIHHIANIHTYFVEFQLCGLKKKKEQKINIREKQPNYYCLHKQAFNYKFDSVRMRKKKKKHPFNYFDGRGVMRPHRYWNRFIFFFFPTKIEYKIWLPNLNHINVTHIFDPKWDFGRHIRGIIWSFWRVNEMIKWKFTHYQCCI